MINIPAESVVRYQDAILEGFQAAIDNEENCDLQVGLISMILGTCISLRGSIFSMRMIENWRGGFENFRKRAAMSHNNVAPCIVFHQRYPAAMAA